VLARHAPKIIEELIERKPSPRIVGDDLLYLCVLDAPQKRASVCCGIEATLPPPACLQTQSERL
jgi:hypothetical protein